MALLSDGETDESGKGDDCGEELHVGCCWIGVKLRRGEANAVEKLRWAHTFIPERVDISIKCRYRRACVYREMEGQ